MDLTKFALYTALAIVTYLMLLSWQEDYPPIIDDGSVAALKFRRFRTVNLMQQLQMICRVIYRQAPLLPQVSSQNDTPTVAPVTTSTSANTANPADLISVRTDTFDIRINPIGGDIVYLALPLYLKQIDVADDPFVLLDNQPGREYVAQSGLIGRERCRQRWQGNL